MRVAKTSLVDMYTGNQPKKTKRGKVTNPPMPAKHAPPTIDCGTLQITGYVPFAQKGTDTFTAKDGKMHRAGSYQTDDDGKYNVTSLILRIKDTTRTDSLKLDVVAHLIATLPKGHALGKAMQRAYDDAVAVKPCGPFGG